jgi:hypothetical protein
VGEWESGRVGEWESGRVGEWESGRVRRERKSERKREKAREREIQVKSRVESSQVKSSQVKSSQVKSKVKFSFCMVYVRDGCFLCRKNYFNIMDEQCGVYSMGERTYK